MRGAAIGVLLLALGACASGRDQEISEALVKASTECARGNQQFCLLYESLVASMAAEGQVAPAPVQTFIPVVPSWPSQCCYETHPTR